MRASLSIPGGSASLIRTNPSSSDCHVLADGNDELRAGLLMEIHHASADKRKLGSAEFGQIEGKGNFPLEPRFYRVPVRRNHRVDMMSATGPLDHELIASVDLRKFSACRLHKTTPAHRDPSRLFADFRMDARSNATHETQGPSWLAFGVERG